ncbi:HTH-type transcriptional regulator VirS [compost metagenome]
MSERTQSHAEGWLCPVGALSADHRRGRRPQLLDDSRRELAQPNLTLLEVAYLLGLADPSNFFRAFRRWFAITPGEYRARL